MRLKNYILLTISTLTLAGCTSEDITNTPDDERIPLRLEATLSGDHPVTRATNDAFESTDQILSYVEHVDSSSSRVMSKLVSFTTATQSTSMYWDDFSDSSSEDKYLRTTGHGLRSYYGYCYNGGTPTTALVDTTGVLGWTTDSDQSTAEKMKVNDLLWSATTSPVPYDHASKSTDEHGTIEVPFTHAMSKFTIVVVAGDGFKAGDFESTTVTLKNMTKTGTFTAPSATVSDPTGIVDVTMYSDATDAATATTRTYEAITVPLTELTEDEVLAVIENAGGNNYEIKVTKGILGMSDPILDNNWSGGLKDSKTQSGYNYKLTVTLKKQAIDVKATLAGWNDVNADGTGVIQFSADVTDSGVTGGTINEKDEFSLWRTTDLTTFTDTPSTTAKYTSGAFKYTPVLYWENASTNYYFRALAELTSGDALNAVTSKNVSQGTDLLWGTTAMHGTYEVGGAIAPRTGDVPLAFEHAMSKVVVKLQTTTDNAAVDLTKATYELTNLSTSGTIALTDGSITADAIAVSAFTDGKSDVAKIMIPHETIGDAAKLIINLHDGATDATSTTYSLQLNKCKDNNDAVISKWLRGNQYNYTITLTKEAIKFRAVIKDWDGTSGSGNATLDWD